MKNDKNWKNKIKEKNTRIKFEKKKNQDEEKENWRKNEKLKKT